MKHLTMFGNAISAILFVLLVSVACPIMPSDLFDYTTRRALYWINPRRRATVPISNR